MLNDATGFSKVIVATGYTDLRRGIEGLATGSVNAPLQSPLTPLPRGATLIIPNMLLSNRLRLIDLPWRS